MITGKDDDAASSREDSFLAELVPQAAEHLAGQHAGDYDADAGRARFLAWLARHTEGPAAPALGAVDRSRADTKPGGHGWRFQTPAQIIGELLIGYPEAASLQSEASHRRALARSSEANVPGLRRGPGGTAHYEELQHRLDPPRRRRSISEQA